MTSRQSQAPSSSSTTLSSSSPPPPPPPPSSSLSFIDIGANLLDEMYQGNYRGKQRHDADLSTVLQRAYENNVEKIIVTCGTLDEARRGLELSKTDPNLFFTVGVHPTRCKSELYGGGEGDGDNDNDNKSGGGSSSSWDEYLLNMRRVVEEGAIDGSVVAIGELGLDYARLHFCDKELQKEGFIAQLGLAKTLNLPLFLHNRETGTDLLDILKEHYYDTSESSDADADADINSRAGGVVHSFDDTLELAQQFMDLGLYIGLNGCSLKTEENLRVAKEIPLNRLLLETDCPWCDIRATHAGFGHIQTKFPTKAEKKYEKDCCVKGRYEPVHIIQVAEVIAGIKGISVEEVAAASKANAIQLFGKLTKR